MTTQETQTKKRETDMSEKIKAVLTSSGAPEIKWDGSVSPRIITPTVAAEWLARNTHNRKPITNWIDRLCKAILRGEWQLTPAVIAFDWNGVLLDGQNRLAAIVQSGRPCVCLVGVGFDPRCFASIDCGCKRTFANVLDVDNEAHYVAQAATFALLFKYMYISRQMAGSSIHPTHQQLLDLRAENPGVSRSVSTCLGGWRLASIPQLSFCHYLFAQKDSKMADEFMRSLISGANLSEKSPIHTLRSKLEANRASKSKISSRDILALIIKAWNYERCGVDKIPFLRWSEGAGELFPEIK